MYSVYSLLNTLWFLWILKYLLFWLYLWQLKDYHIGRLVDHFRTHKGAKILLDPVQAVKIILLVLFFITGSLFEYFVYFLILVYFIQVVIFFRGALKNSVRKPVKTVKTLVLVSLSIFVMLALLVLNQFYDDKVQPIFLLIYDILLPFIISAVVLIFQPFSVLLRNKSLEKAADKLANVKSYNSLKVIAITGSYGKTSTKEFLYKILSRKFNVLKTREHQNSEIGVAKCILEDLNEKHQIFIAEVGAYNKGKVKEVCTMLKPKIGIVTGVNEQHMALFGSLENLLSAEGGRELANILPKDGALFVNGDNKYCLDLYKRTDLSNKFIYSLTNETIDSDIWSEYITVQKEGISFVAIDKSGTSNIFEVKVLGKQNVQNLLGAILVAKFFGMNLIEIAQACRNILPEHAGMVVKQGKYNINIIDSSYSSNPDGVLADLDYLKVYNAKRVVVMPCLIELGKKSSEVHFNIGKKIAEICDLAIITTRDKFKEIKAGCIEAGMAPKDILLCDNSQDIYSLITLYCKEGDAVLLEGRVPQKLINLLLK
jgi:UDP-N-acetylmuramoyl-tripeptide--D-alanyl-D-alanine ligase